MTAAYNKELQYAGMVTGAGWLDYDRDGDADLAVTGEWMKVRLFRNDGGTFTEVTDEAGLGLTAGWWNCLLMADVDGDGDEDMIGGNLGRNAILKASVGEPVELYVNDFDNNGVPDPVICSYQKGRIYPVASLDELSRQISGLRKKYPRYSDFAGKSAPEIFGKEALKNSLQKKAVLLESSLFINKGDGKFSISHLPVEVQFSPVQDGLVRDFDGDGQADLLLTGNDYPVRPSLGRYDASYGWYLQGTARDIFRVIMPEESGFITIGDTRRIVPLNVGGVPFVVAGLNNDSIKIFKYRKGINEN